MSAFNLITGTSSGAVQVYNLSSGQLNREFSVHSCTVRYEFLLCVEILFGGTKTET